MIGERRERIRFLRRTRVKRTDGGYDVTTATLAERWASIKPVSAREGEDAGRNRGATLYVIDVDQLGSDTVTPDDMLLWLTRGDMKMNIREVRVSPRNNLALTIVAEAGAINAT